MPTKTKAKRAKKSVVSGNGSDSPMVQIDVTIEGVTPLMMHRMTEEEILAARGGPKKTMKGELLPPKEEAEKRGYFDEKGRPFIPGGNLYRCIIEAGRHVKLGRAALTNSMSSKIPAIVQLAGDDAPVMVLQRNGKGFIPAEWDVVFKTPRPPGQQGIRTVIRPTFENWLLQFSLIVDTEYIDLKSVRDLIDKAGRFEGLGPQRPSRKGQYGRFVVAEWNPKR